MRLIHFNCSDQFTSNHIKLTLRNLGYIVSLNCVLTWAFLIAQLSFVTEMFDIVTSYCNRNIPKKADLFTLYFVLMNSVEQNFKYNKFQMQYLEITKF